ncbi:MAG: LemA family protein [Candidatus Marinimicrobia bacterium]|nr:LemA family protein [Candidatus Neomarinimicrobiota bacterium]
MNTTLIALLIFILFISIFVAMLYNMLVRKRNQVDNAFGGMDVQLKKRYDLIPNLVTTVKQYAAHENDLLTRITEMRSKVFEGNLSPNEKVALDNQISAGMRSLLVAVENYPDLKASENFINLQRSLNETEAQISAARRTYNAVITDFNNAIQSFPSNILAGMMGLAPREVFVITETERQNVELKNLFNQ